MRYLKLNKLLLVCTTCALLSACIPMPATTTKPDAASKQEKPKILAPAGYNNAIAASKAGNYDEAIKLFTELAATNPDYANAYTNLGLLHWQKGNKNEAEQAFRKALSLNSKDAVAYNHLGIILRDQGKFSDAKNMYENAIQYKPDYAIAWLNLGILNDLYLQDLPTALSQYNTYQTLTGNQDKTVEKWIIDLDKRIQNATKSTPE